MARKTKKTKVSTSRSASRRSHRSAKPGAQHLTVSAARRSKLQELVERHRNKDRVSSWDLGNQARQLLDRPDREKPTRTMIADLAERIGLIRPSKLGKRRDESNLRQLIKFASTADRKQAQKLTKAGVPWRAIVWWIGVEKRQQRDKLYREMLNGLTNSNQIRAYINRQFKKPAPPRRHSDLDRMVETTLRATDRLVGTLDNLKDRLDEASQVNARPTKMQRTKRRRLLSSLEEASKRIRAVKATLKSNP